MVRGKKKTALSCLPCISAATKKINLFFFFNQSPKTKQRELFRFSVFLFSLFFHECQVHSMKSAVDESTSNNKRIKKILYTLVH